MGGDARHRLRPTGTAPRTITAGRSSTTEWKREGRERKEEKKEKRESEAKAANLCAVSVD